MSSDLRIYNGGVHSAADTLSASPKEIQYVSVVLPCLNEERGVGPSVADAIRGLARAGVRGEVIVVDNGSTDGSIAAAEAAGAQVVLESRRGTGVATFAGVRAARGDVIVTADADQTYDLENLEALLGPLRDGADLVVGSRLQGRIADGAMPLLHRRVGTPLFNTMLRVLTGARVSDSQSGYRAFWKDPILALNLRTPGFESVSEVLLRASRAGLDIRDVPSDYRRRVGDSKLNTVSDGWKHLRMLLIYSPHLTLVYPGVAACILGTILSLVPLVAPNGLTIGSLNWGPVFIGPLLLILGAQGAILGALASHRSDLTPPKLRARLAFFEAPDAVDSLLTRFLMFALAGLCLDVALFGLWVSGNATDRLIGLAGIAEAAIVVGIGGIVTVFAADFSRESL